MTKTTVHDNLPLQPTTVYLCDNSVDGIFTAIYKAWEAGTSHTNVRVRSAQTLSFFENYIEVEPDPILAQKVARSIIYKLSDEVYYYTYHACLAEDSEKANYIYRFLRKAFRTGKTIIHALQDEDVLKVFELTRAVSNESHFYLEFARFEELENGILASRIDPKNNIIFLIADHFSDRLHCENFIILDTRRNIAVLHSAHQGYVFVNDITEAQLLAFSGISDKEQQFQDMWKCFFDTIAIKERKNLKLQRSHMPLRYRRYMHAEQQCYENQSKSPKQA